MQLISGLVSNNAAKVRMVLAEKDIEYETIEVNWTKADAWIPKPEILLRTNPRAEVPVLIDDELTLWDSTVINEYLEERYPQPSLLPVDAESRALSRLWEDEGDFNQRYVGILIKQVFLAVTGSNNLDAKSDELTDELKLAHDQLEAFYRRLENQLEDRDYLLGRFSLADISVFVTVAFAFALGVPTQSIQLQAWFDRVLARPAIRREYDEMMAAVAAL